MSEFEKYHKIKILGDEDNEGIFHNPDDEIIVEEKMDGGNFRFFISKYGEVICGSRTRELDGDNPNSKTFKRCIEFVKERVNDFIKTDKCTDEFFEKNLKGLIFYGECMISHTMAYDWEKVPPYLGFDIKNMEDGTYLDYDKKVEIFDTLLLPIVPLIKRCKAKDIMKMTEENVPVSKYVAPASEDRQAEGIVMKNYKEQKFAKFVREKFKETSKATWGNSKKLARLQGDDELLIATYCTNPRIEKMLFKLIDEGHPLDMTMMHELPRRVMEDIYEEHWKEICWSNWSINFKNLRKKIPHRCIAVLKQVIVNTGLSK